jgi:hypothetical protein
MSPFGIPDIDLLQEPLPKPMFPKNYEGRNRMCVYGEAFKEVVVNASGWQFIDEGSPGKRKWGFISNTPGSILTIKVGRIYCHHPVMSPLTLVCHRTFDDSMNTSLQQCLHYWWNHLGC